MAMDAHTHVHVRTDNQFARHYSKIRKTYQVASYKKQ
jgi:predicted TIM-barrel fold metal-dependent hydrolase